MGLLRGFWHRRIHDKVRVNNPRAFVYMVGLGLGLGLGFSHYVVCFMCFMCFYVSMSFYFAPFMRICEFNFKKLIEIDCLK
jgi:hypothetical protein